MNLAEYKTLQRPKRSKYLATPTDVDGFRFDSKLEATYYCVLKVQQQRGEIDYFLRQVPIHLPGNYKMVIDFVVFMRDGTAVYQDVKGMTPTRDWINKKKATEAHYPLTIQILTTPLVKELATFYAVSV